MESVHIKNSIPPTIEQVTEYAKIHYPELDPEKFFWAYEMKGWMVGKVKMKDWQAAVRNWKVNGWGKAGMDARRPALLPIIGKICSREGCGMPAVYKSGGAYDHFYCEQHMPDKVKQVFGDKK